MREIQYKQNSATGPEIIAHLRSCDASFYTSLSQRVDIPVYVEKLLTKSTRFEAWDGELLVGFLAQYHNEQADFDFISNISVAADYQGQGIASVLLEKGMQLAKTVGEIRLEVAQDNAHAIQFYKKAGFILSDDREEFFTMIFKTERAV